MKMTRVTGFGHRTPATLTGCNEQGSYKASLRSSTRVLQISVTNATPDNTTTTLSGPDPVQRNGGPVNNVDFLL